MTILTIDVAILEYGWAWRERRPRPAMGILCGPGRMRLVWDRHSQEEPQISAPFLITSATQDPTTFERLWLIKRWSLDIILHVNNKGSNWRLNFDLWTFLRFVCNLIQTSIFNWIITLSHWNRPGDVPEFLTCEVTMYRLKIQSPFQCQTAMGL